MIVESAIFVDNKIYRGKRHCDCFKLLPRERNKMEEIQGFVNDKGEFLDRFEALTEASKCNQLIYKHIPYNQLLSEDLY